MLSENIEIILQFIILFERIEIFEMCWEHEIGSACQWAKRILFHDYMLFVMERLCANVIFFVYFIVYLCNP